MVDQTANFVRGEADSSIAAGDTTISVVNASEFPDPANGQYNLVLWDDGLGRPDQDSDAEIVRVTGRDTTNNDLTVTRAQEGTSDVSHPSGSALQLSPTANVIDDIADQFTNIEVFTSDGTFDASDIDNAFVELVGGGGGSHGLRSDLSPGYGGHGAGGGGYAADTVDLSADSSITVTVGTGGSGGAGGDPAGSGGDGGSSSFGTLVEASGGGGSDFDQSANPTGSEGSGGTGQTGSLTVQGGSGSLGTGDALGSEEYIRTGAGGDSVYGHGGQEETLRSGAGASAGGAAYGYGAGAGGRGVVIDKSTRLSGSPGAYGVVIVRY